MQRTHTIPTILVTMLLVTAGLPAVLGATTSSGDTTGCDLTRSGTLAAGDAGFTAAEGFTYTWESIPTACQGEEFTLEGSNPGDDFDVDFFDGAGNDLDAHANAAGDEAGTIPGNAVEARIVYWLGAAGTYTFQAPPATGGNGGNFTPGPDAVSDPVTLFLRSGPTGVGNVDAVEGASTMDTMAPTKDEPSVWHSNGLFTGDAADATWTWSPEDGFNLTNMDVTASFWAATPGTLYDSGGWNVQVLVDGAVVAEHPEGGLDPADPGTPARFEVTLSNVDLVGEELALRIDPYFIDSDWTNAILYDSVDYASNLDITAPTPDAGVENLTVEGTGATHVALSWDETTLDAGLDHYRILRDGTVIAEPEEASFLDTGLSADATYTYEVEAVGYDGNSTLPSDPVSATTDASDTEAPALADLDVEAGASSLRVTWTTEEAATGTVTVGTQMVTTALGTTHDARFSDLEPGATVTVDVETTDLAGNANTTSRTVTMATTSTLYLHNQGDDFREFMNEFDEAGDNDGRGWNNLGGAIATVNHQTDTAVIPVFDAYPAEDPVLPALALDASRDVTATVYVNGIESIPNADAAERDDSPGYLELELTLLANDGDIVGRDVQQVPYTDESWIPVDFAFTPQVTDVDRGSLVAELRAEASSQGYVIGYEGDHASRIHVPVEPGLPLQMSASLDEDKVMTGANATFSAEAVGGSAPYTFAWSFSDGATATGATVEHTFTDRGPASATVTVTDDDGHVATRTLELRVHQRDFVDASRTVVAVVDTGINPYHPVYQRPGAEVPAFVDARTGNASRVVDLADSGSYEERVKSYRKDRAAWAGIGQEELVTFAGTNALGISFADSPETKVLDSGVHGTATSSTVLANHPDALVVMVQVDPVLAIGTDMMPSIAEGVRWAAEQPWIDVISVSMGVPGNGPTITEMPNATRLAHENGKVVVVSAGNDPSPAPTDSTDGPPWVLSVTGSQADGRGHEVLSGNHYPDYTSDYTVDAAAAGTTEDEYARIGGTSFSCPTVAGTVAGIVHALREDAGHTGGIVAGELAPGVTNGDVRAALNRTAVLPAWDGYVAGINYNGDHTHPPGAPWLTAQWGHVDARIIPDATQAIQDGTLGVPSDKTVAAQYKLGTYQERVAYWT